MNDGIDATCKTTNECESESGQLLNPVLSHLSSVGTGVPCTDEGQTVHRKCFRIPMNPEERRRIVDVIQSVRILFITQSDHRTVQLRCPIQYIIGMIPPIKVHNLLG